MFENYSEELEGFVGFVLETRYDGDVTDKQIDEGCRAYLECFNKIYDGEVETARKNNDMERLNYLLTCRPFVDVRDDDEESEIQEIIDKAESIFLKENNVIKYVCPRCGAFGLTTKEWDLGCHDCKVKLERKY